jgi:hypothetical protein
MNDMTQLNLVTRSDSDAERLQVGVFRLMPDQDYPHDEGTFPCSPPVYQMLFGGPPDDEIRSTLSQRAAS